MNILPAALHSTTDWLSPIRAADPLALELTGDHAENLAVWLKDQVTTPGASWTGSPAAQRSWFTTSLMISDPGIVASSVGSTGRCNAWSTLNALHGLNTRGDGFLVAPGTVDQRASPDKVANEVPIHVMLPPGEACSR